MAKSRLPKMFYDFVDSGSWTQATYHANAADFQAIRFRQRIAKDIETRATQVDLLGTPARIPVAISPTGLAGFVWPDGEILAAKAAARFGVPYSVSIGSVCSLEEIRKHSNGPIWLQISILKDKPFLEKLLQRAEAAQCSALILTMDYHIAGQRHCDIKNGMGLPPKLGLSHYLDMMQNPTWCFGMLRTQNRSFGNVIGHAAGVTNLPSFAKWHMSQFEMKLDWSVVEWVKARWKGPLIIKGVLDPEDARLAVEAGADAISVSNQGGRQLDGAPSSVEALAPIVAAVGDKTTVLLDGGIRSGQDVLRACALGAKGVLIGRAALYGMAGAGEEGVLKVLQILEKELNNTMAFCGLTDVRDATPDVLWPARQG